MLDVKEMDLLCSMHSVECLLYWVMKCRTNIVVASQQAAFDAEMAQKGDKIIGNGRVSSETSPQKDQNS